MQPVLDGRQFKKLASTLRVAFCNAKQPPKQDPADLLSLFLTAKEVEGCSPKTIAYYRSTLEHMASEVAKPYTQVTSDDLRAYLTEYEAKRGAGNVTIDNIRRIMSSFFSWLEDEDYVVKSPVRRIHSVKTAEVAKEVLSDEQMESLRGGYWRTNYSGTGGNPSRAHPENVGSAMIIYILEKLVLMGFQAPLRIACLRTRMMLNTGAECRGPRGCTASMTPGGVQAV